MSGIQGNQLQYLLQMLSQQQQQTHQMQQQAATGGQNAALGSVNGASLGFPSETSLAPGVGNPPQ